MYDTKTISIKTFEPLKFIKDRCNKLTLILCLNIAFLSLNILLIFTPSVSGFNTENIDTLDELADAIVVLTREAAPKILGNHKSLISSDYPNHFKINPQAVEIKNKLTELNNNLHNLKSNHAKNNIETFSQGD